MPPAATESALLEPSSPALPEKFDAYQLSDQAAKLESRNFLVIALYQIIMRTGWIFKTESVVMPAVLDTITGGGPLGGLLRGMLPVLNRFGHSVPPLLVARRVKIMPRKRLSVLRSTLAMAGVFLVLSLLWWCAGMKTSWWMWLAFLVGYSAFFAATGINNLSLGTMQGKLIHATRRGRLLTVANTIGALVAIVAAAALMPLWLTDDGSQFHKIFGFTGVCFVAAALCVLLCVEPPDDHKEPARGVRHIFTSALAVVRSDANFRRLVLVGMAFGSSLVLFPHYQALARSPRLNLPLDNVVIWVIVQNAGTALFSLLTGPLADRRGNRVVMRLVLLGIAAMPATAIVLSYCGAWGRFFYPIVFVFIGLTPVGFKTLNNYTLEISPATEHPRYLSTLGLGVALPLLASPLLGWLVEVTTFELVFFTISATVFSGWLLTLGLEEPRDALADTRAQAETGLPEGS